MNTRPDLYSFACDIVLTHANLITKDARGAEPDYRDLPREFAGMTDVELALWEQEQERAL